MNIIQGSNIWWSQESKEKNLESNNSGIKKSTNSLRKIDIQKLKFWK